MKRRLSLKSEPLADLTTDDLTHVQGGAQALSDQYGRCTLDRSYLIGCYSGRVCSLDCPWTVNTCEG